MPEGKKSSDLRHRAQTHTLVMGSPGYRVQTAPKAEKAQIKRDLKALEDMGMVTFVPAIGWIDTMPALIRYQRKLGMSNLFGQGFG